MSQPPPTIQSTLAPDQDVTYIDTIQAYDQWANIYDSDGNFLQALDTIEMRSILPEFWNRVKIQYFQTQQQSRQPCKLVDLGCGTGRNTLQLLKTIYQDAESDTTLSDNKRTEPRKTQIIGLDASNGMLDVARARIEDLQRTKQTSTAAEVDVILSSFDFLNQSSLDSEFSSIIHNADGMISTLVLEHIPLDIYFSTAASILRAGAYFLVTNMHADMGRLSQAGFIDSVTGKKVRPLRSYAHEITDILAEAAKAGFEIVPLNFPSTSTTVPTINNAEGVMERKVTEDMVEMLGTRSEKYIGVTVWLGICLRKI